MDQEFWDRRRWFDKNWHILENLYSPFRVLPKIFPVDIRARKTCPCCGYPTLPRRYCYEICMICWWEDDGQDDVDAAKENPGPNLRDDIDKPGYTLYQARMNFKTNGIMFDLDDERFQLISIVSEEQRKQLVDAFDKLYHTKSKEDQKELFHTIKNILKRPVFVE